MNPVDIAIGYAVTGLGPSVWVMIWEREGDRQTIVHRPSHDDGGLEVMKAFDLLLGVENPAHFRVASVDDSVKRALETIPLPESQHTFEMVESTKDARLASKVASRLAGKWAPTPAHTIWNPGDELVLEVPGEGWCDCLEVARSAAEHRVYKAGYHDGKAHVLVISDSKNYRLQGNWSLGSYDEGLARALLIDATGTAAPLEIAHVAERLIGLGEEWELSVEELLADKIPKSFKVWTDGSTYGGQGPGGYAAIVEGGGSRREYTGGMKLTTNNQMELMGAIAGLEVIPAGAEVTLYTDSQYVQRGLDEWLPRWRENGWLNAKGDPVANRTLWERLEKAASLLNVTWVWVPAHAGNEQNERADQLARTARDEVNAGKRIAVS